jgi:opacity protein-like surface antigen
MKSRARIALLGFFMLGSFTLPAEAAFDIVACPKPACSYGNAETETFHRAVSGAGPLTRREQEELALVLPEKDWGRYYGRVDVNFSTLSFDQIKNRAAGIDRLGAPNVTRVTRNQVGVSVAIGYAWSRNFRGDAEYFANRTLNYNANPALIGVGVPARQVNAQIKSNTLLLNLFYDFDGIYRFRPYLTAGVGATMASVQSSVFPAPNTTIQATKTLRTLRVAFGGGAGIRIGLFTRWFLDASVRYIRLGNGVGISPVSGYKLLGTYSMNAASVGAIFLF